MLWPFNTGPHVAMTPTIRLCSLLLHFYNFVMAVNHNVNIFGDRCLPKGLHPLAENWWFRRILKFLLQIVVKITFLLCLSSNTSGLFNAGMYSQETTTSISHSADADWLCRLWVWSSCWAFSWNDGSRLWGCTYLIPQPFARLFCKVVNVTLCLL